MNSAPRLSWLAASVVLGVAVAMRLLGLGAWSLDGDELYSWYDVQRMLAGEQWSHGARSHPLGYLLMLAVASVVGVSELALRSASAVSGVLAVAALLLLRADVLRPRVRLGAATLAACSPWLIYHAQTARFYAPLLLFSALATLWALQGPKQRPRLAAGAWVMAVLCHPTALLLGPGLLAPLLLPPIRWRWLGGLGLAGLVLLGAAWALDQGGFEEVVLRVYEGLDPGSYSARHFVVGLGYNVGPVLGFLALLAVPAAWRDRRGVGLTLLLAAGLPLAILLGPSLAGFSTHQRYVMCSLPAVLLLAGRAWDALSEKSPVIGGLLALLALGAFAPQLVAYRQDGNRHDLRGVAAYLTQEGSPGDLIVADEHATLEVYLHREASFADIVTHEESAIDAKKRHDFLRNKNEVWVAVKLSRLDSGYGADFKSWLHEFFSETHRVGVIPPALARHDNRYVIYRRTKRILP